MVGTDDNPIDNNASLVGPANNRAPSVAEVLLSADLPVVVGLAFAQAWITIRWFCLSDLPFGYGDAAFYLMASSCLVATVALLLCALFSVQLYQLVEKLSWAVVVSAISLAAAAAAVSVPAYGLLGAWQTWAALGGLVSGVGSSLLLLSWFVICVKRGTMINLSLGFLLASLLVGLFSVVEGVLPESLGVDALVGVVPVVCSSLLLLQRCFRRHPTEFVEEDAGPKDSANQRERFFAKTCMGALFVGLANELIRFASSSGPVLFSGDASSNWITVVVLVAVNLGIARQLASGKPSSFYFVCRGAMILSIAGALLYPYAAAAETLMLSISVAGRQCVQILVWIIVFQLCWKYRMSPVKLFGGMCGVWYLGSLLGMVAYRAFGWAEPAGGMYGVSLVSVLAVLLLVVAFGLMFSEKDSALLFESDVAPKRKAGAFARGCERLIEQGGLTKRESDVLWLLAKGASVSHIEEKLCISASTVSTHMKHIYQKLGVHSRKELYDLVEKTADQCALEGGQAEGVGGKRSSRSLR